MFNLSGSELIFMVVIALVVLGPDKLPEAMRKAGKAYSDFKRMTSGFQSEMKSVLDEPMRELRETAELAKNAAAWDTNMFDPKSPSADAKSPGGPTDRTASTATSAANGSAPPAAATPAAPSRPASPAFTSAAPVSGAAAVIASSDEPAATSAPDTSVPDTSTNVSPDATSRRLARQQASDSAFVDAQPTPDAIVASAMMTGFGTDTPEVLVETDEVPAE